jgi:hypothetical protein
MRRTETAVHSTLIGEFRPPLPVRPASYELPGYMWNWCLLGELSSIVKGISETFQYDVDARPEDLVRNFAALVRYNRDPLSIAREQAGKGPRKKLFRYSLDGIGLRATEVPSADGQRPPHAPFRLFEEPYPDTIYVPEGWAYDTLRAVRRGVYAVVEHDRSLYGWLRNSEESFVLLEALTKRYTHPDP